MDEPIKRRGRITTRGPGASRVRDADLALLQGPEPDFVSTDPWRALRILGEFVEGFDLLARVGPAVSVFGSARTGPDDPDYAAAVEHGIHGMDRTSSKPRGLGTWYLVVAYRGNGGLAGLLS